MNAQTHFHMAVAQLLEISPEQLALDAQLNHFETWDSLAMISVIALVTEHFGVSIPAESVRNAQSLSDVLDRVRHARAHAHAHAHAHA